MYQLDTNLAKKSDFTGGRVTQKGAYVATIERAEHVVTNGGAIGVSFSMTTSENLKLETTIYTYSGNEKGNKPLSGLNIINAMMTCLRIRSVGEPVMIRAKKYNYDTKQDEMVEVPQFSDFIGKKIGVMVQFREDEYNGKVINKPEIRFIYEADTNLTASEILDKQVTPKKFTDLVSVLQDKKLPQSQSVGSSQQSNTYDDDSIPF